MKYCIICLLILNLGFLSCGGSQDTQEPQGLSTNPASENPPNGNPSTVCNTAGRQTTETVSFQVPDSLPSQEPRTFIKFVPGCFDSQRASSLMIFFHGWTADAEGQVGFTGLSKLAQKENFLLVYAESGNNTIGGTKGWHLPHQPGEESLDVYYVDEMIHKMKADFPRINNIYGCGHSQGGRFTIRMATDRPQYFSAMCAFAPARLGEGNPFDPDLTAYDTHHLPFFIIQGNNDSFVSLTRDYTELHEVLNEVENYNNFENPEVFASIANGDAWDWNLFSPLAGDPGTEVMWLYIDGMGHIEWPSVMSHDITTFATPMDVNDLVWEFFKKHQM